MNKNLKSITIISDCIDDNAKTRQICRYANLFPGVNICYVGISGETFNSFQDLSASGNMLDVLDSYLNISFEDGISNLIVVNVAPRNGTKSKFENGTPFGYFYAGNTLIISSVEGYALSLPKKFGLINKFFLAELKPVINKAFEKNIISEDEKDMIINTQFRSYEYLPRLAFWLIDNTFEVPSVDYGLENIMDLDENRVWFIDNFGNCKTTISENEFLNNFNFSNEKLKDIIFTKRLKDVEKNNFSFIVGSSGLKSNKFVELVCSGASAKDKLSLKIGDII